MSLRCHLDSFRYGDHILRIRVKGRETIALVLAQPPFFSNMVLTKLRDKIIVLSKMTNVGADFARFRSVFFSIAYY